MTIFHLAFDAFNRFSRLATMARSSGVAGTAPNLDVHMHHGKKREIRLLFTALG